MDRFASRHRVRWLVTVLALCVARTSSAVAAEARAAAAKPAAPPNVLFIVVDDLNDSLGCYGFPAVKTPNIDRLAAASLRFDRAYVQYPLCNPSRASFLTGLRPEALGIYDLKTAPRAKAADHVFLPQLFRQHGYTTGRFGKIFHEGRDDRACWDVTEDIRAQGQEAEAMKRRYANAKGARTPDWMVLDGDDDQTRDGRIGVRGAAFIEDAVKQLKKLLDAHDKPQGPAPAE